MILGLLYKVQYPQVTWTMSAEDCGEAAVSCFIVAALYAFIGVVSGWQWFVHWRYPQHAQTAVRVPLSYEPVPDGVGMMGRADFHWKHQ